MAVVDYFSLVCLAADLGLSEPVVHGEYCDCGLLINRFCLRLTFETDKQASNIEKQAKQGGSVALLINLVEVQLGGVLK